MTTRNYIKAIQDFKNARRQAALDEIIAQITGRKEEIQLLPYDEVRKKLRATETSSQRLEDIPLDAIVGSVGRYHEFTRSFLPRKSTTQGRWARVMAETLGMTGLPPVEVYKIGEAYFVKDGNHRVSVARQLGNETIQGYVTEVKTKVPLTPDTKPDDLIIKAEHVNFLEQTHLDQLRPEADLTATKPGAYPELLKHIEIHRYFMGLNEQREIPYREAVTHWYDHVYLPVTRIIKDQGILREFPRRTETDLYLWLADHRADLERKLGWDVGPEVAASDLASRHTSSLKEGFNRLREKLLSLITPEVLDEGPPPGTWREEREKVKPAHQLFKDILVAIDHSPRKEHAMTQASTIAHYEGGSLHGIHIHPPGVAPDEEHFQEMEGEFIDICRSAGIDDYDFTLSTGEIDEVICDKVRFTDLLVLPLNHPPGEKRIPRLGSGMRSIIRRCPRPILAVPGPATPLKKALLAYDGSPKAREALYVAAYIANRWNCHLTVITSQHGLSRASDIQREAEHYLRQRGVKAKFVLSKEEIAVAIHSLVEKENQDLILIGGYGATSVIEVVLGSSVDQVLREIQRPILICR